MNQSTLAGALKALSDPLRLRILGLLGEEELSVGELTGILGMAQSRVSNHLSLLKRAGVERSDAIGPWLYSARVRQLRALEAVTLAQ